MGFYFRKSFKCGPIRFNLSQSGIGTSIGIKGLRYGINAKGKSYVHAGRYGMYYRKQFSNTSSNEANYDKSQNIKPLNKSQKAVINCLIYCTILGIIISALPDNSHTESICKLLIYLYPTLQAIWNKSEVFKSFYMNFFLGWTIIGWLYAFAWIIPKKYDINKALNESEIKVIEKAQKLLAIIKDNPPYLDLLPSDTITPLYVYLDKDFSKLADMEIELLAEGYENLKSLLDIYKKKLPPLRRQQAKVKGYKFARTTEAARDNRLRGEALLKDDIFWQYFATDLDKQMRDNPC